MKKELELLKEVIDELKSIEEYTYNGYESETIHGGGGWYEGSYLNFDEYDRDEMVKKLENIYNKMKGEK